jgi:homoserine dehydrogenase
MGMTIKYMTFAARKENGKFSAYVEPALIPAGSMEAFVPLNYNMVTLFGEYTGRLSFYGQGAGKYPTGNSLAQDVIDILNGDTTLTYPKSIVKVDNSEIARTYYVRTSCDLNKCLIYSKETVDGINYIITNKISVKDMHEAAKAIFTKDSGAFFAGIEE